VHKGGKNKTKKNAMKLETNQVGEKRDPIFPKGAIAQKKGEDRGSLKKKGNQ